MADHPSDPYTYPGTDVLINRFGTRDPDQLYVAEYTATVYAAEDAPQFPMTAQGYRDTHKHLFRDVYDWAGEYRIIDFSKQGNRFIGSEDVPGTMTAAFHQLARDNLLQGLDADRFSEAAARHLNILNIIHPFREGNGRTMHLHLEQLARQAGHNIDTFDFPEGAWEAATIAGFHRNNRPLTALIRTYLDLPPNPDIERAERFLATPIEDRARHPDLAPAFGRLELVQRIVSASGISLEDQRGIVDQARHQISQDLAFGRGLEPAPVINFAEPTPDGKTSIEPSPPPPSVRR